MDEHCPVRIAHSVYLKKVGSLVAGPHKSCQSVCNKAKGDLGWYEIAPHTTTSGLLDFGTDHSASTQ